MKEIRLLILLLVLPAFAVSAQEGRDRWAVGVSGYKSINYDRFYIDYFGFSADVYYRFPIKRSFNFHPSASLYYYIHGKTYFDNSPPPGSPNLEPGPWYGRYKEFGINLALPVGFHLKDRDGFWDLETGPMMSVYFYQKLKVMHMVWENETNRFMAYWRFSVGRYFGSRIFVKFNYDLAMTHQEKYAKERGADMVSLSVGYNF